MLFHAPWGLLALFSIPVILGLHFFRSRKQVRRIGGLHLWEFARLRPPVGGRFERLIPSFSLFCQLLAALLASLLLAGIDRPRQREERHYAVVLDDSLSMQAGLAESSADRARAAFESWAGAGDRFTLIAAGLHPRLLCEPFAPRAEALAALAAWQPAAPAADLAAASALAAKFLEGEQRALCFTDDLASATPLEDVMEIGSVGQALANNAFVFVDRVRVAPGRDRVLLRLQRFAAAPAQLELTARLGGQVVHHQSLTLDPQRPLSLAFETTAVDEALEVRLPDDPLPADHVAVLAPVVAKPVRVGGYNLGEMADPLRRAVAAAHDARYVGNPAEADLLFARGPGPDSTARHICSLPTDPTGPLRLAQGHQMLPDHTRRMVAELPLEGLLWAYAPQPASPTTSGVLIEHDGQPLLAGWRDERGRTRYSLNLVPQGANLFRHTAWPLLVQGMIEACRADLPGMDRSNFRTGETVFLRLPESARGPLALLRGGAPFARYEHPPQSLSDLPAGLYELMQGDERLARFAVNQLSSQESDLSRLTTRPAVLDRLSPSVAARGETDRRLFFALTSLLILCVGLSWVFQDMSR